MLDLLYSRIARARRRYYERRPHLRRRLDVPVISIGNLTVGGSGTTPLAAEVARILLAAGERPSILSRGYARRIAHEGVVIVSDGTRVLVGVERSGDEPQMLARTLPGVAVLVSTSRYAAGRIAETRLGCTVHILDDGFQHFDLMRDIDLLVSPEASDGTRTLPFGRLREPLDVASAADALMIESDARSADVRGADLQVGLGVGGPMPAFAFSRRLVSPVPDRPAFAFAGIAKPERFFSDLERAGWKVTGRRSFRDHHHYSAAEIEEIARAAAASGAEMIVTTEKDIARIPDRPDISSVALEVTIEPAFRAWLAERLRIARSPGGA